MCFTDLGKLSLLALWFNFKLKPIFATAPASSKMTLDNQIVKIDSKTILPLLPLSKSVKQTVPSEKHDWNETCFVTEAFFEGLSNFASVLFVNGSIL